jgi:hypothetical protein
VTLHGDLQRYTGMLLMEKLDGLRNVLLSNVAVGSLGASHKISIDADHLRVRREVNGEGGAPVYAPAFLELDL